MFWLNNDRLLVVGRQKFDFRVGGKTTKWFRDKAYIYDANGEDERELFRRREDVGSLTLFNRLPLKEDKVLVSVSGHEFVEDIYEVDLNSFNAKRVYRGAEAEAIIGDYKGDIRGKLKLRGTGDGTHLQYSYKHPETGKWEPHHKSYAAKREGMNPVAFDKDGRRVYMQDNTGRDKAVIRAYDLITRTLSEPLYGGGEIDALDVLQATNSEEYGAVIGYIGRRERLVEKFTEPKRRAIREQLDKLLPGLTHNTNNHSDDLTAMVVFSSGPREPGIYHLLINGTQLIPLGRSYPHLLPEKLADMAFVSYRARDGLTIPAFLTLPREGNKPFPAVVLPHGGPWARDFLGWDRWVQFLANRGYAVLQPQYRGSEGWGQKLWRAGDREWGQKMQDDKDDGAHWLVEQGIADADRLTIYGYSYGGYAAMAASVRPNSPYQCAISGAGLAELRTFAKATFESPYIREFQNPTVAGLSPLDRAAQASIPIYIFHGDRDQRVPVEQSRKFANALKRAGKDVAYTEIVDLWHSLPWWPQHHLAVLASIEDYLANDCGPGGL